MTTGFGASPGLRGDATSIGPVTSAAAVIAVTTAFRTAGVGVRVIGFAGAGVADAGRSVRSSGVAAAVGASAGAAVLRGTSDVAEVSPAPGFERVGTADVGAFFTVVDFAVGFFAVVDFDDVDFTVVDFVGLVFFVAGDAFVSAGFFAGETDAAVVRGVAFAPSATSGFATADCAESDAATVCFFTFFPELDAACLFALVVSVFGAGDVFFALVEDFAFWLPGAELDELESADLAAVARFAPELDGFFAAEGTGFFAAEAGDFFDGVFFAAGFLSAPEDTAVTSSYVAADGASEAWVSGAWAGWVASSPGGVSSEEEEGAEVTHEIYQLGRTTASSARN